MNCQDETKAVEIAKNIINGIPLDMMCIDAAVLMIGVLVAHDQRWNEGQFNANDGSINIALLSRTVLQHLGG